jgi:hypothetical protein
LIQYLSISFSRYRCFRYPLLSSVIVATGTGSIGSSSTASAPVCTSNTTYPSQAQIGKIFGYLTAGNYTAFFANVIEDVDWSVMGTHPLAGNTTIEKYS